MNVNIGGLKNMKCKFNLTLTKKGYEYPCFNEESIDFDTIETLVIDKGLTHRNELIDNMIKLGYANLTPIEEYVYELLLTSTDDSMTDTQWDSLYKKIKMKVEQSMNHNFEIRLENLIDVLSDVYKVEFKITVE